MRVEESEQIKNMQKGRSQQKATNPPRLKALCWPYGLKALKLYTAVLLAIQNRF